MPSGHAHHDQLVRALSCNEPVPPAVARWYLESLRRWRKSTGSLESALGIVRSPDALAVRDANLQEAGELMPHYWTGRERVRQVQQTAKNLATFSDPQAVDWSNRPAWHAPLFLAMQAAPLPGRRRLFDLCNFRKDCTKTPSQ